MRQHFNISALVVSVWDTLATYQVTKNADDLLPALAELAAICGPVQQRQSVQKTGLSYVEYQLMRLYACLQCVYIKGRLSTRDIKIIVQAIDKLGVEEL